MEVRHTFSATKDVSADEYRRIAQLLGRTEDEVRLKDVQILVLLQPPHRPQADRHVRAAVEALKWFGLLYGRYPYDTLTVVDPAPGAGGAGGMDTRRSSPRARRPTSTAGRSTASRRRKR